MGVLVFIFIFYCVGSVAQTDSVYTGNSPGKPAKKPKDNAWKKNITYGGNFQAWVGSPSSFIFLSPTVGYNLFENFNVGIGGVYNYFSIDYGPYGRYSRSVFGGDIYARYVIKQQYFVQLQYDKLLQPNVFSADPTAKTWVDYMMVGGGFRQPVGENAAIISSIMYNLTPSPLSIYYPNRIIIQFGFVGGFN